MKSIDDRLVLVPASALGALVEAATFAVDRLNDNDEPGLATALRGSVAAVRAEATYEP